MKITPVLVALALAWLVLAGFAWHIEFLAVYLILSALVLIFLNTGTRKTGPRYVHLLFDELALQAMNEDLNLKWKVGLLTNNPL